MSAPPTSFAEIFNSGYWEGMQEITDGTLQTDDGKNFRIHRVVLSQSSSYFRALFSFHLNQETVVIPCIDSELFEIILIYIYTNKIALDEKNVYDLLMVLDYLLLDDLLKSCEAFAIQNMTSTNCLSLLTVASDCNRSAVFEKCYRYVLVHFEDILEASNGEFEILPLNILNQLLESNSLNVISEISVWKAIVSWTEAKGSTRLPHVPILLTFLRLEEGADEELVAEILSHSIVSSNPHIFGLMMSNDFRFHATCTPPSQHARLQPCYKNLLSSYRPRVPSRMMLQIGQRIYMFDRSSLGAIFDIVEEEWLRVREIPPRPSLDGWIIILREQLYHIGQRSRIDHDSMNMISSYDFERNSWELITHIRNNVIYGAVTFKDRIFIVGVSKIEPAHMVCLAYDPANETWTMLPSPNIFREKFSVVACHEKVFVISGLQVINLLRLTNAYVVTDVLLHGFSGCIARNGAATSATILSVPGSSKPVKDEQMKQSWKMIAVHLPLLLRIFPKQLHLKIF
ncbi:Kelch-like protein 17 [Araneus ventricosus]|uniref:Kelch-like protein 17 n=1 Tax=Araneus ventricosus TaxID=182803 RepID=A0A4Y2NRU5_ARAVE|nr:Kelch-like protein 17 [Araneus ventricosus]